MKVLVTGATTPLGAAIVTRLLATPHLEQVLAVGHEREPMIVHDDRRLVYHTADLTHARLVHDLLWGQAREHGIDAVIHVGHHRRVRDRGAAVHAQNVEAVRELVVGCANHPTIRRFVYRSFAEVYALRRPTTDLLDEEAPLDFDPGAPQWLRDRVEADATVCEHLAGPLPIAVLRLAEVFAPDCGSQLWDYLSSRVCLRPLGFDPMINVLSVDDAAAALVAALHGSAVGVFNIPGADTLPLSRAIAESVRIEIPVPGPAMSALYGLRRWLTEFEFRYDLNVRKFHFGGVLDGTRARKAFGYAPHTSVQWPRPWWRDLIDRLFERPQPAR